MQHVATLFRAIPWWELVPDLKHELIVEGRGEYRGLDLCTSARTPDRRLAIAYLPTSRSIVVDLGVMAGPRVRVTWFDPEAGSTLTAGTSEPMPATELSPPDAHDWALILRTEDDEDGLVVNPKYTLGGEIEVGRLGFGAMRIVGDRAIGSRVLRRAVELGVTLIDTADVYGAGESEEIVAAALYPYREDVVIATKGGIGYGLGDRSRDGRPEYLRRACDASLRRLRRERIDLYQLHIPDPEVPIEESVGALEELRTAGKIRMIGAVECLDRPTPNCAVRGPRRVRAERVQPRLAHVGERPRGLRGRRDCFYPLAPAWRRTRPAARRTPLASRSLAGAAADSRHFEHRAPRGEHGGARVNLLVCPSTETRVILASYQLGLVRID